MSRADGPERVSFYTWADRYLAVPRWIFASLYFLFVLLGVAAVIIGVPTIELSTPEGWVGVWGVVVITTGIVAGIASLRERFEIVERWSALLMVAFVDSYTGWAWILVFSDGNQLVQRGAGAIVLTIMAYIPTIRLAFMISRVNRAPKLLRRHAGDTEHPGRVGAVLIILATLMGASSDDLPWLPAVLALVGVLAMGLVGVWTGRQTRRAAATNLIPPTWPEILSRFDTYDKKLRLLTGMMSVVASQWPPGAPPPLFSSETLRLAKELDDSLVPEVWRASMRSSVKTRKPRAS